MQKQGRSSLNHLKGNTRGGGDLHSFLPFMKVAPSPAERISRFIGVYVHQRVEVLSPKEGLGCLVPWSRLVSI